MLNHVVNTTVDRRLAAVLGPRPIPRQAAEIAADIAALTDSRTGQWAFERLAASRGEEGDAQLYPLRLQQMIHQLTADSKETPDEAPQEDMSNGSRSSRQPSIAILLVLNAVFVWSTGTRLERRLVELRQSGDPVQLSDLAREPIPPERDADVYLRRAADDVDAIHKELLAMYPKTAGPGGVLSTGEQEKLDKLFSAYPRLMPLLEQAAACPDYDPQIDGTLSTTRFIETVMARPDKHRVLARVLRARAALLDRQGPARRGGRQSGPPVAADPPLEARAAADRLPDHSRVRAVGHGGREPGAAGRARVARCAAGTRGRAGPSRHDGRIRLGNAERAVVLPVVGAGSFPVRDSG